MLGVKQNEETEAPQITAQDEALKRNTDCVYFLASPLTCKKGIECEYRHSDIARLNPQDCWFWLNGNCLNPKCAFRHPPLDGLLGTQVTTAVNSLPPSQTMVPVASQGLNVPGKQAVPCIFFQKGYCLKGDMCPFMHAPYSLNNKATQSAGATPVSESQPNKKTFGGLGKHAQVQKFSQGTAPKSAISPQEKIGDSVKKAPLRNEISISRNAAIAAGLDEELPQYRPGNVHSFSNGNSDSRSNRNHQVHIVEDQSVSNVKDTDEVSRELSPGFDVLVDDELMDSEYYPDEDGIYTGHDGMNLGTTNEYGIRRSSDYGPVADVDRDMYPDKRNYDSFERLQGHYRREVQRSPSERVLGGSAYSERRRYPRADSPGQINGSDLRHHLSKQKRNTGLRSIISRDRTCEGYADDRSYRAPERDHLPTHDNLVSSRLRGRIKIPGKSVSPVPLSEKEIDRARLRGRLSSERPLGRLRDRIKGRAQEDFINERNFRGSRIRRDAVDDKNADFSGPKSLSELKVAKTSEIYEQPMNGLISHGKRKYQKLEEGEQGEGDISFEGPKPLSEILKRKRGGNVAIHESGSTNGEEHNQKERKGQLTIPTEAKESNIAFSTAAKNEGSIPTAGEVGVAEENNNLYESQSSLQRTTSELQLEEGMIGDEAYDQKGDGFDYDEQADGKDYNLGEGENADPDDDYFDEDDDADDFAKKMGVLYS